MREHNHEPTFPCRCFRCQAGCIHLVIGNTMLTLTQEQFLAVAKMVGTMRNHLQAESEITITPAHSNALVM